MDEIDYTKYTKKDLADILSHIDREMYPERTALVQSIYDSKEDTSEEESAELNKSIYRKTCSLIGGVFFIICAPFALIYGAQSNRILYSINIESLWARIITALLLLYFGIVLIKEWDQNEN